MVIIVSQQSTFRRYAAKVLSPFFIFAVFGESYSNNATNWRDKLRFLLLGLLLNNSTEKH